MDYSVVEPSWEYFERKPMDYLLFLERCGRTCYKSEDLIKEGSAERLLSSIVKNGHLSVLEHENNLLFMEFGDSKEAENVYFTLIETNPFFAFRTTLNAQDLIVSGNIRMWLEFMRDYKFKNQIWYNHIQYVLNRQWPFFFPEQGKQTNKIHILQPDPTVQKNLRKEDLKKHLCMTYKCIMDRSCSHQWVRHRKLTSFSQESQRFCNYGKKGLQFIVPPSHKEKPGQEARFINDVLNCYGQYLEYLGDGIPPEDARFILPNAIKTEIVTTTTIEQWQWIFSQRCQNSHAQWEIKQLTQGIKDHMKSVVPEVFNE